MSIENLNTYCIAYILKNLSMEKVSVFSCVFPEHQEATDAYWMKLRSVLSYKLTYKDLEAFSRNINLCINVNELELARPLRDDMTELVLNGIANIGPSLEILDISGMDLTTERTPFLRYCDNLQSLTVQIPMFNRDYRVPGLFSDRTKLRHLRIIGAGYVPINFKDFPIGDNLTLFAREFQINGGIFNLYPGFWRDHSDPLINAHIYSQLERIQTSGVTFLDAIAETQTSLKSFRSDYGDEDTLETVFSNNHDLEDVTLRGPEISGVCLRSLPRNIKRLSITNCYNINTDLLIPNLQNLNLESLELSFDTTQDFLRDLVAAAPTLLNLTMNCDNNSLRTLAFLQELKQLKTLRLLLLEGKHNTELIKITDSCVNLEQLEITGYRLELSDDLFASIAALPKLQEIVVQCTDDELPIDYNLLMHRLSSSQTITSASFNFHSSFTEEAILTLIRGSNILTNLKLEECELSADLVTKIKEVLAQQENRTNVLNLSLKYVSFSSKDIPQESSHPLLKVIFFK